MKIAVEVSLYPLHSDYLGEISEVVKRLNNAPDVQVVTNQMSTQVCGEFDAVMGLLNKEIYQQFEKSDKAVFVCKFLNKDIFA